MMTMMSSTRSCPYRRNVVVVIVIILGLQWIFGSCVYPSISQPLRGPKPISPLALQPHEEALTKLELMISRELLMSESSQKKLSKGDSSLSADDVSTHFSDFVDIKSSINLLKTKTKDSVTSHLILSKRVHANASDVDIDAFERWKSVINERKLRLRKVCHKYGKILKKFLNHERLLFDTKHHIAYCRHAKAGTTTWLSELLEGAGVNVAALNTNEIHTLALEAFPLLTPKEAAVEMDHPALLFAVVRHPFTRLVSAYRDKIQGNYRKDVQREMVAKYRYGTNHSLQNHGKDDPTQDPSTPTFREFTQFVSDQILSCPPIVNSACLNHVDNHWRPFYDRCAPCDLHYDVISKMETFQEDQKYIKKLTGLSEKSITAKAKEHSHAHASNGPSSANLTRSYFSQLTVPEQQKLYKAYFFDFQLFDYSPNIIT